MQVCRWERKKKRVWKNARWMDGLDGLDGGGGDASGCSFFGLRESKVPSKVGE